MTPDDARTKRFDEADADRGPIAAGFETIGAHWVVFSTAVLLSALSLGLCLALTASVRTVGTQVERLIRSSPISVALVPSASREATDAVRSRLAAMPGVADTVFVPKDEGLRNLVGGAERVRALAANPLPDVVVVHLRATSPSTSARRVAETLRGDPTVGSVRYDDAWIERLDAWAVQLRAGIGHDAILIGLLVTATVTGCIWALASNAMAARLSRGVFACIGTLGGALGVLLTGAAASAMVLAAGESSAATILAAEMRQTVFDSGWWAIAVTVVPASIGALMTPAR